VVVSDEEIIWDLFSSKSWSLAPKAVIWVWTPVCPPRARRCLFFRFGTVFFFVIIVVFFSSSVETDSIDWAFLFLAACPAFALPFAAAAVLARVLSRSLTAAWPPLHLAPSASSAH
jgi:hypothetical protein